MYYHMLCHCQGFLPSVGWSLPVLVCPFTFTRFIQMFHALTEVCRALPGGKSSTMTRIPAFPTATNIHQVVWGGVAIMTLGTGLIIDLDRTSGWDKIVIYQIIGGIGCGPLFQSPLIAIQANIDHHDVGTATVAFSFLRTLGTALAICIGLVVFQNSMQSQSRDLAGQLPGDVLDAISGRSAASSVGFVQKLEPAERVVARDAYAQGLSTMWCFFLAVSVCGLLFSLGIRKHHLSRQVNSSQPAKVRKKKAGGEAEEV